MENLLSVTEIAARLDMKRGAVLHLINYKRLAASKCGKNYVIRTPDFVAYLNAEIGTLRESLAALLDVLVNIIAETPQDQPESPRRDL